MEYKRDTAIKMGFAFVNWFLNTIFIFAPAYLKSIHLSGTQIGVLTSMVYIFPAIFYPYAGHLCDVLSPKIVLGAGFILFFLFSFLIGILKNFEFLLTGYVAGSIGMAFINISIDTIFYREEKPEKNFSGYIGSGGIGMGIGYIIAGFLTQNAGFPPFFYLLAGISLITSLLSLKFLKYERYLMVDEANYRFWKDRRFILLLLVNIFHGLHFGAETSALAIFFKNGPGLNESEIGIVLGLSIFFLSFCGLFTKRLSEMGIKGKKLYSTGLFLSGTGSILMVFSKGFNSVLLFRFLHVAGDAFIFVGSRELASSIFGEERIGRIWGGIRSGVALSAFIGAIVSGVLIQFVNSSAPFIVSGVSSIFAITFLP